MERPPAASGIVQALISGVAGGNELFSAARVPSEPARSAIANLSEPLDLFTCVPSEALPKGKPRSPSSGVR